MGKKRLRGDCGDCCVCQLCPSTMAQGQEPGGHWGSRAAPSESSRASFSPDGFLPGELLQWAPLDQAEAPGSPGGGGAEGAGLKGVAPCSHLYRARPRTPPSTGTRRPQLHGASALTSVVLGGGHPQCPAPLSGHQENRSGLCNFSSTSLKESGIPHLDFFCFCFWPLRTFSAM